MAFPTAVNSQITDAVTQSNLEVLGVAPAVALGNLYQATAQALANAAHNATNAQQQSWIIAQAATTAGVALIYGNVSAAALHELGIVEPEAPPAPPPAPAAPEL
jgi:2-methylisocitrate lyase-like PEP mutase family enzyme